MKDRVIEELKKPKVKAALKVLALALAAALGTQYETVVQQILEIIG